MSREPLRRKASHTLLPAGVYPDSPVTVRVDELEHADGIMRAVVVEPVDGAAGVVIVARDTEGRIALVRQYRVAVGAYVLELPRGFGTVGAEALQDARRELLEEVGARAGAVEDLGFLFPDSGLLGGSVCVVRASMCERVGEPTDVEEIESVRWLDQAELVRSIADGEVHDGIGLAALMVDAARSNLGG